MYGWRVLNPINPASPTPHGAAGPFTRDGMGRKRTTASGDRPRQGSHQGMFSKILIANRGEIAVRIIKTCRRMGIKTVVVYSEADAGLAGRGDGRRGGAHRPGAGRPVLSGGGQDRRRRAADGRGGRPPRLRLPVSENAGFARRLRDEGIVFIGPNPDAIDAMGDKISSKKFAAEAGVSTVPGHMGEIETTEDAVKIAERDRLSGDDQGLGRRRRQGHPRRPRRRRHGRGLRRREGRGQERLRRRPDLHREVHHRPAPHRDPGAGRQARQRRPPVRARMLDPAPQPEGHRGGAVARCWTRPPAPPWAPRPSPWPRP